ncbi:MAG: hypothetical protein FRX49_12337 [Trebouxia sp. A1-2]|nr:MAG: hypothetical protein FRX49_12337 [Trebouxia sp. A1-2]
MANHQFNVMYTNITATGGSSHYRQVGRQQQCPSSGPPRTAPWSPELQPQLCSQATLRLAHVSATVSFEQLDMAAWMKGGLPVAAPSGAALWWSAWLGMEQSDLLSLQSPVL